MILTEHAHEQNDKKMCLCSISLILTAIHILAIAHALKYYMRCNGIAYGANSTLDLYLNIHSIAHKKNLRLTGAVNTILALHILNFLPNFITHDQ